MWAKALILKENKIETNVEVPFCVTKLALHGFTATIINAYLHAWINAIKEGLSPFYIMIFVISVYTNNVCSGLIMSRTYNVWSKV